MKIEEVSPLSDDALRIIAADGRVGSLDVRPYFDSEAFRPLKNPEEFAKVRNRGYYVEWACGADLSADTIEARWIVEPSSDPKEPPSSGRRDDRNQASQAG